MSRAATLLAAALLQGCIYVPHTTSSYDEECKVVAKEMTLKPQQLVGLYGVNCAGNRECAYVLVGLGAVTAVSVVVSGSIVVVGNIVYWLERQGHCALAPS